MRFILLLFVVLLQGFALNAQDGKGFSVTIEASYKKTPQPSITLSWDSDPYAQSYNVYRKDPSSNTWEGQSEWGAPIASLGKDIVTFTDEDIQVGIPYEYQILKVCIPPSTKLINVGGGNDTVTNYLGSGYVLAGIDVPPKTYRGTVILLIDSTMITPLSSELNRLEQDLNNELWNVIRKIAPRSTSFNSEAVLQTKDIIRSVVESNPEELYSILIIGRIPVPYSGLMAPDGHSPDHVGAWPAEGFYVDFDGNWTDATINNEGASRAENKNVIGDGKYDKSTFDIDIRIPVGRIDFYNLTSFAENEIQLLKRYLDKNHAFRIGQIKPVFEATVDDNFGAYGEGFSGSAYRGFGALVGKGNIIANREFLDSTKTIMFAYGCGAGSYTSCNGVGGIAEFSKRPITSVFTSVFGSYFGDWDSKDNVLRSVLASRGSVLTTSWAARPSWFYHPMGLGSTIGDVLLIAQNNTLQYIPPIFKTKKNPGGILYHFGGRGTHIALMGDPTLRMTSNMPIAMPTNIATTAVGTNAQISWSSVSNASGYMVYKSSKGTDPYELLTPSPITETTFLDITSKKGEEVLYQVRTVMLRETKSGSFYEASIPATSEKVIVSVEEEKNEYRISCSPQPMSTSGVVQLVAPHPVYAEVTIHSLDGRVVTVLHRGRMDGGGHTLQVPAHELIMGMYIVRAKLDEKTFTSPLIISK
ncbi:MAG: hypothetical protein ACKN9Y_07445 [Bacteroidota bacterium]